MAVGGFFINERGFNMNTERNFEIYQMRLAGKTLKEIATQYKLTPERARQICLNMEKIQDDINSELYQFIVGNDEQHTSFKHTLYNTLKRIGINNISSLKENIDSINNDPESYVYIGEKTRLYLNSKLEELAKDA